MRPNLGLLFTWWTCCILSLSDGHNQIKDPSRTLAPSGSMEGGVALSDGQRPAQRPVNPQTVRANFNQWPAVPADQIGSRRDEVATQPAVPAGQIGSQRDVVATQPAVPAVQIGGRRDVVATQPAVSVEQIGSQRDVVATQPAVPADQIGGRRYIVATQPAVPAVQIGGRRALVATQPAVPVDQIGGRRDVVAKQPAGSSVLEIQLNLTDLLELGDMSRSIGRSASVMVTLETVSDTPADQDEPLFDNSTLEESEFYAEDNEEGGRIEL